MNRLVFEERLDEVVLKTTIDCFTDKVREISRYLEINPNWLMAVMELETGGTFDPSIQNKLGYTGLIQFGKTAAKSIGTTTDKLKEMDAHLQLDYVQEYFEPYRGRMSNLVDVYLAVFFPVGIGKHDGWVLHTSRLSAERIAKWNPLFDVNKDNAIQIWEIKRKVRKRIPSNYSWIL